MGRHTLLMTTQSVWAIFEQTGLIIAPNLAIAQVFTFLSGQS